MAAVDRRHHIGNRGLLEIAVLKRPDDIASRRRVGILTVPNSLPRNIHHVIRIKRIDFDIAHPSLRTQVGTAGFSKEEPFGAIGIVLRGITDCRPIASSIGAAVFRRAPTSRV